MRKDIFSYCTVIGIVLISTFLFWLPFLIRTSTWFGLNFVNSNFLYIYSHYDGPFYAIVAKTFYAPALIEKFIVNIAYDNIYYAAHLPFYPLLVRLFAPLLNYSKSTVFVNVLATSVLAPFFYFMVKKLKLSASPVTLTAVFLMLPRFLIIRSVGAPESLFILLILLSLYFFEKDKFLLAGVFGGLATMTKTPGILLFIVYFLVILEKIFNNRSDNGRAIWVDLRKYFWLLLIPSGLLIVFYLYQIQYHDFFAYFHSGDNIHLQSPFSVFNQEGRWVGTGWLEDVLFYYFIYLLTVFSLKDLKYRSFFYFCLVFFSATIFVQHRDISRYSLPLWPMAVIAFDKFFTSKKFLYVLILLLPAIYLYAWNFSLENVMPISDWTSFFSK